MEQAKKTLKNDYILLVIWEVVLSIVTFIRWNWDFSLFGLILRLVILAIGYYTVMSKNIIGGYVGIGVGVITILTKNVVSIILGGLLIFHSIKYLKVIKF